MARWLKLSALVAFLLACSTTVLAQENATTRADSAYERGDFATALTEYERVVADYPGHPIAWLRIARIQAATEQWRNAVTAYRTLDGLGPMDTEVRTEYADALRQAGELVAAIEQYELVLAQQKTSDARNLAEQAYAAGDFQTALERYQQIVREYPTDAAAWRRIGQIHSHYRRWSEAVTAYERLVSLGSADNEARMEYGDALRQSGDLEGAVKQYSLVADGGGSATSRPSTAPGPPLSELVDAVAPTPVEHAGTAPGTPGGFRQSADSLAQAEPAPVAAQATPSSTVVRVETQAPEVVQPVIPAEVVAQPTYMVREVRAADMAEADAAAGSPVVFFMERDEDADGAEETPRSAEEWLTSARSHAAVEEWLAAVEAYEEYLALEAGDTALMLEYADALREAGYLDQAEAEYSKLLHSDPESADARIGLAKVLALDGELEEAMYLLDQIELDPRKLTTVRLTRAYCYFVNGYVLEAWQDIGDVLALDPANAQAIELLLQGAFNEEQWQAVRSALAVNPANAEALELMDMIVASERLKYMGLPGEGADRAEALFLRGEYEEAKREFEEQARRDPLNARTWLRLGTIYRWEEDWEESLAAYEEYLRMEPDDPEARLRYAQALLYSGAAQDAVDELEMLLRDPDVEIDTYEAALLVYASALNAVGRSEEALEWYEEALMFTPHNLEARVAYGDTLAGMQRNAEAVEQYNLALREDPTYEPAKLGLARAQAWSGELAEAAVTYDTVSASSPHYASSRIGKAYAYLWQGDRARARALADEAARLDPDNPDLPPLYEALESAPVVAGGVPVVGFTWSQSHDSDDNDVCVNLTRVTAPVGDSGVVLSLSNEDFKLDNTLRGEESIGHHTRLRMTTPVGRRTTWTLEGSYLDVENSGAPELQEWNWGTSFNVGLTDDWRGSAGYRTQVFYDTTELVRNNIRLDETWVQAERRVIDADTWLIGRYAFGDLSDGNERHSWALNLRRSAMWAASGRLDYGVAFRVLNYKLNLNSGYWDPHNYRYGEFYADWLDLSDRPVLIDAGIGWGLDKETNTDTDTVFRYNVGLRKRLLHDRLTLRAGYSSSDASTNASTGPGYEYESWYLGGEYVF
jgi:tetratricopeptide (TPR) repeat protein